VQSYRSGRSCDLVQSIPQSIYLMPKVLRSGHFTNQRCRWLDTYKRYAFRIHHPKRQHPNRARLVVPLKTFPVSPWLHGMFLPQSRMRLPSTFANPKNTLTLVAFPIVTLAAADGADPPIANPDRCGARIDDVCNSAKSASGMVLERFYAVGRVAIALVVLTRILSPI
jgi:hypothetical protein